MRFTPRKPIAGQHPPYQQNDFSLSEASRPQVPRLTARLSTNFVDMGQETNFTQQLPSLAALESFLPTSSERNFNDRLHYDYKKLKYSNHDISEFFASDQRYEAAYEELMVIDLELDNVKTFSRRQQYQVYNYITELGGFGVVVFFLFSALGGVISRLTYRVGLMGDFYQQQKDRCGAELTKITPTVGRGALSQLRPDELPKSSLRS